MSNDKNNDLFEEDTNEENWFDDDGDDSLFEDADSGESLFEDGDEFSLNDDDVKNTTDSDSLFEEEDTDSFFEDDEDNDESSSLESELVEKEKKVVAKKETSIVEKEDEVENDDEDDEEIPDPIAESTTVKKPVENSKKSLIKDIALIVISSSVALAGSYVLFGNSNSQSDLIKELSSRLDTNEASFLTLKQEYQSTKGALENSLAISTYLKEEYNAQTIKINKQMENLLDVNAAQDKQLSVTLKLIAAVNQKTQEINNSLDNLPKTSGSVAQKVAELEKKLGALGALGALTSEVSALKDAVSDHSSDLATVQRKIKEQTAAIQRNVADNNSLKEKALDNSQRIVENSKGIRSNNQKIQGEASVKELLANPNVMAKEVRAVSVMFDNNQTVNINSNAPVYKIVGKIIDTAFYAEMSDGEVIGYNIGDNLDGYGEVLEIKDKHILTTNGMVKIESGK